MPDFFSKISTLFNQEDQANPAPHRAPFVVRRTTDKNNFTPIESYNIAVHESLVHETLINKTNKHSAVDESRRPKETPMEDDTEEDNLKALKHLRDLPRGTNIDSRIAGIKNLLGDMEVYRTLKMLRWPQGVVCPRCYSKNVVRREPPKNAADKRHYYVCLNCKGEGNPSDFDDLTGLPEDNLHALRQWILCWYLIGFCSVHQIAKVLGISVQSVIQIANFGSDLTSLSESSDKLQARDESLRSQRKAREEATKGGSIFKQEEDTRSESKAPLKPGYKSKK